MTDMNREETLLSFRYMDTETNEDKPMHEKVKVCLHHKTLERIFCRLHPCQIARWSYQLFAATGLLLNYCQPSFLELEKVLHLK